MNITPLPDSTEQPRHSDDNFASMAAGACSGIQYKLLFCAFALFLFLQSDLFIGQLLSRVEGAVQYSVPTSWGTIIQGVFLIIGMLAADCLIRREVI